MVSGLRAWVIVNFLILHEKSLTAATGPVVSTAGPTLSPDFIRKESKVLSQSICPESHPSTLDLHKSCCSRKKRDYAVCNDGTGPTLREWDPLECCPFGDHVPCPDPPCKAYLTGPGVPRCVVHSNTRLTGHYWANNKDVPEDCERSCLGDSQCIAVTWSPVLKAQYGLNCWYYKGDYGISAEGIGSTSFICQGIA